MQTKLKTIIKLSPRVEVTPKGNMRTVYRRTEYSPSHPDYQKELAAQKEYVKKNGYLPKVQS